MKLFVAQWWPLSTLLYRRSNYCGRFQILLLHTVVDVTKIFRPDLPTGTRNDRSPGGRGLPGGVTRQECATAIEQLVPGSAGGLLSRGVVRRSWPFRRGIGVVQGSEGGPLP